MTRVALDSNILIYLAGGARTAGDEGKIGLARSVVEALPVAATVVVPVQALGEAFVVLRRLGLSLEEARAVLTDFAETFTAAPSLERTALAAADLVVDHKLQFWDALILSAAAEAGCTLLLSENMQDGFVARGLTVVNPFADPPHPKLTAVLAA